MLFKREVDYTIDTLPKGLLDLLLAAKQFIALLLAIAIVLALALVISLAMVPALSFANVQAFTSPRPFNCTCVTVLGLQNKVLLLSSANIMCTVTLKSRF